MTGYQRLCARTAAVSLTLLAPMAWSAAAAPPRLAIVTRDKDPGMSDLVFSQLAQSRKVQLVERDKLAALIRELELSAGSRSGDVKAGQLLGAQGLLFIETDADFRHVVLVETSRGERLFDLVRPREEARQDAAAGQVCHQVLRHVPQLTAGGRAARHIAVLPFEREDGVTPRGHDLDTLTVLVASALAQQPRIIVVERENLANVVFEPALAGATSNALETADFVLRGSATRPDAGHLKLNLRLNPSRGGEIKASSFVATATNLHDCAQQMLDWVAGELGAGRAGDRIDNAEEAELYFQRGTIYRAQGKLDPFRCFELAYELAPTNRAYATTYLGALQGRWEQSGPVATRCDYFLRALDVVRMLDPEMTGGCLPFPAFLLTVAREDETCREGRQAAADYYKKYCRLGEGLPDIARRNLWATICPAFFDTPEEALAHLRWISTLDGYDWNLAGHRFLSVSYWDTKKAQELWQAYLEELCRHPAIAVQLQAHRALLARRDLFSPSSYPPGGERTEACTKFYDWLCSDTVQPAYAAGGIEVSGWDFWRTFWYLEVATQEKYWDRAVTPRLRRLPVYAGMKVAEVGSLYSHLMRRYRLATRDADEAARILRHVAQARETVKRALDDYDPGARAQYHCDEQAESFLTQVEDLVRNSPPPAVQPPETNGLEITGATLLFDYRRELPEAQWKSWPVSGTSRLVVEQSRAWLGITAANRDNGPGLLTVAALDLSARTSRVCAIKAPGVGSGFFRTPVLLAKTAGHICLAEFHNVLVLPLAADGVPDERGAVFIGPEQGLPATGLRNPNPLDSFFVSALAGCGGSFYLGVGRPVLTCQTPINYGGLFRWTPGAAAVARVAACDSLEPGPFNDCEPYLFDSAAEDEAGGAILFQVKRGLRIVQFYGTAAPWKFTPPSKWAAMTETPAQPTPWRVTYAADGKTFALEYVAGGRVTTWQTFARDAFSPGELTVCEGGLLWLIHRERPLVYFIPKANWPGA